MVSSRHNLPVQLNIYEDCEFDGQDVLSLCTIHVKVSNVLSHIASHCFRECCVGLLVLVLLD